MLVNQDPSPKKNYDLSEEASMRDDEEATRIARQVESDDINEESADGSVSSADDAGENRVWTSSSED